MSQDYSEWEIQYMTRPEVEEAFKKYKMVILPIGATEQHGPHLPLGTDTFIANNLAVKLAEKIKALVLPTVPFSYSWVWRDIPGSIVVNVEHFKALVEDIVRSIANHHIEKLIIVNAHGANDASLKYAVRELSDEINMRIFYFTYPAFQEIKKYTESPIWHDTIHACEIETSLMLATNVDLCHMERAVCEYPDDRLFHKYRESSLPLGLTSKSGVFGDATLASKEKGEVMIEVMVNYMVKVIQDT